MAHTCSHQQVAYILSQRQDTILNNYIYKGCAANQCVSQYVLCDSGKDGGAREGWDYRGLEHELQGMVGLAHGREMQKCI